ncbi:hypothetical protein L873DRAFT_1678135 [Choiromyces venosus 120613-1]|uniref:Uncharacterized protein n=1 Tax=Choiromyces venosus 120613-1 TaxID=1336337 RepID=A0A3N4JW24_9PEZI|nr:hypothetical protein L873DRAFT_1678135 [Choiromyces venosus 120613-1]
MTQEIPDVHRMQIVPPSPPPMASIPPPQPPPQRPPPAVPISIKRSSSLALVPVSMPYNAQNQNRSKHSRNISTTTTLVSRPTHSRKISLTTSPDQIFRIIRDRSRDSYQKIKEFPAAFQYAVTPSAPSIQAFSTNAGRSMHSIAGAPVIPSGPSCTAPRVVKAGCAGRYADGIHCRFKGILNRFHFSVSVGCTRPVEEEERKGERTLRIKNNRDGCCIYEVENSSTGPTLTPLQSLKPLLPNSKYLQKSLKDWNRHFQSPPAHWVINFIPRAYLRRGYYLAEDVCEYLLQNPDGCLYRIEYEPIGHESVLVGSIVPRGLARRERNPSRYWEGKGKRDT